SICRFRFGIAYRPDRNLGLRFPGHFERRSVSVCLWTRHHRDDGFRNEFLRTSSLDRKPVRLSIDHERNARSWSLYILSEYRAALESPQAGQDREIDHPVVGSQSGDLRRRGGLLLPFQFVHPDYAAL